MDYLNILTSSLYKPVALVIFGISIPRSKRFQPCPQPFFFTIKHPIISSDILLYHRCSGIQTAPMPALVRTSMILRDTQKPHCSLGDLSLSPPKLSARCIGLAVEYLDTFLTSYSSPTWAYRWL